MTPEEELASLAEEYENLHARFFETWQSNSVSENEALRASMKQIAAETARIEEQLKEVTSQGYTAKREMNIANMKAEQLYNDFSMINRLPKEEPMKKWENPAPKMRWTLWGKLWIGCLSMVVAGAVLLLLGAPTAMVVWCITRVPMAGDLGWSCVATGVAWAGVFGLTGWLISENQTLKKPVML